LACALLQCLFFYFTGNFLVESNKPIGDE
jgi:hypothetical protein